MCPSAFFRQPFIRSPRCVARDVIVARRTVSSGSVGQLLGLEADSRIFAAPSALARLVTKLFASSVSGIAETAHDPLYPSQRKTALDRANERAQILRFCLNPACQQDSAVDLPPKPKGMWRRTSECRDQPSPGNARSQMESLETGRSRAHLARILTQARISARGW